MSALIEEVYAHFREALPCLPEEHREGLESWSILTQTPGGGADVRLRFANGLEYNGQVPLPSSGAR